MCMQLAETRVAGSACSWRKRQSQAVAAAAAAAVWWRQQVGLRSSKRGMASANHLVQLVGHAQLLQRDERLVAWGRGGPAALCLACKEHPWTTAGWLISLPSPLGVAAAYRCRPSSDILPLLSKLTEPSVRLQVE